jgi:hypothetical protein
VAGDDHAVGAERVGGTDERADVAGRGGPVEHHHQSVVAQRDPAQVVGGERDHGEQFRWLVGLLAELREEFRRHRDGVGPGKCLPGPPREIASVGVQQRADGPAVFDRQVYRTHTVHHEFSRALPLGATGEQRLPLLERGISGTDAPHGR